MRDQLYAIARVWIEQGAIVPHSRAAELLDSFGEDDRAEIEERAAVMEYEGCIERAHAEKVAIAAHLRQEVKGVQ